MTKVVACPERYAAEAGMEVLRRGGNAVDAVVAGALAQGVTNPFVCGAGGAGQMNIYMVRNRRPVYAASNAGLGSKARPDAFRYEEDAPTAPPGRPRVKNQEHNIGYKSIQTPDLIQVLYDAHERFGRLPWRDCLQPAVRLAKEGFVVDAFVVRAAFNEAALPTFYATQEIARIYLKDGRPYREGELLVQRDYGSTLEQVAEHGADIFYRGEIAERIAEDFDRHGALVTLEDLKETKTNFYEPLSSTYRGYTFYVNVPPSGGPFKLEALNILEGFDLRRLGWNTPEYLDLLARTLSVALADRSVYSVDPIYDAEAMDNAARLISKEYAAGMIEMIRRGEDRAYPAPGEAAYVEGTTHIVTLDDDGNCVSMKHSCGTPTPSSTLCCSGVVTPGVGIPWNNHMAGYITYLRHRRTRGFGFGPRMKMGGGMSPTLGFKEGELFSASGSPEGHNGYQCEIQALINIIEFGFRVQAAISSPRIYIGPRKGEIVLEPSFPYPYPWKNLEAMGHPIRVTPYTGKVSVLTIDPETGFVDVGTDPRGGGGLARED